MPPVPGRPQRPQRRRGALAARPSRSASPLADGARGARGASPGVARRFELPGEAGGVTFVDDYAHLPTEVAAALAAAAWGPWARVVARVPAPPLQPHRGAVARLRRRLRRRRPARRHRHLRGRRGAPPGVSGKLIVDAVLDAHPWADVAWLPALDDVLLWLRARAAARRPVPDPRRRRPHRPGAPHRRHARGPAVTATGHRSRSSRAAAAASAPLRPRVTCRSGPLTTYRVGGPRPCSSRRRSVDDLLAAAAVGRRDRACRRLVVGKGSNLLVADAGFAGRGGGRSARRFAAVDVDGTTACAPAARAACRWWPARPPRPGLHGLRVGGRRAGLGRRRGADERRRARLRHGGRRSSRSASSTCATGRGSAGAGRRPRARLPPLGGRRRRTSWSRPTLRPGCRATAPAARRDAVRDRALAPRATSRAGRTPARCSPTRRATRPAA